jgi:hypothetical protein
MSLKDINRSHSYLDKGGREADGNPKGFFGWGLVAFIDLLGFSADLASSWSDGDESPLARLLRIKEAAARIPDSGILAYFPGKPSFDPKIHRARVHTVSDSIVVCCALPPAGELHHITMAMTVVSHGVQMAWAAAIREGYTIRGAIELGEIYWSESETIGPAFVASYCLESKIAGISRVVLKPLFLANLLKRMNDDWSEWPSSEWFSVSEDNLIEISLHTLKENLRGDLEGLEALKRNAGANAYRYDHVLETLRADTFRKASRGDIERGKAEIESRSEKARTNINK